MRVLVRPGRQVEIQVLPSPVGAGPFQYLPTSNQTDSRRPLVLDPEASDITSETDEEKDHRLYKTESRAVYDDALRRGSKLHSMFDGMNLTDLLAAGFTSSLPPPEVLLRTTTHILESVTSNIAFHLPSTDPTEPEWITPQLHWDRWPFLDGVMRRYLLDQKVIREGEVTLGDWERVKETGRRVIGFNGLR